MILKIQPLCFLALATGASAAAVGVVEPERFSYQQLENLLLNQQNDDRDHLFSVLQTTGFFSITDIPGMGRSKPETFQALIPCLLSGNDNYGAKHTFDDGTIRQTLAATPGQSLLDESTESVDACSRFEEINTPFRETVLEVRRTVAELLQVVSGLPNETPLLLNHNDGGYNLQSIINDGQQLEHFHVYSKQATTTEEEDTSKKTIDWHTDQGLVLIFSPGLVMGGTAPSHQQDLYVQMADGTATAVEFSPKDELVVMLGEGMAQYINPHIKEEKWRAVPHSVQVQQGPRAWYGLMVLPPSDAIHPTLPTTKTFGELREEQIVSASSSSFGCGSSSDNNVERILQDVTEESCSNETQHFCWHRCMNFTDTISPTACSAESAATSVGCINTERQLWSGDHNPDFALGCIDVATADTAESGAAGGDDDHDGHDHDGDDGHDDDHEGHDHGEKGNETHAGHDHGSDDHAHESEDETEAEASEDSATGSSASTSVVTGRFAAAAVAATGVVVALSALL